MLQLNINGRAVEVDDSVDPGTPLLWVLRDHLGMTGTKYGCRHSSQTEPSIDANRCQQAM